MDIIALKKKLRKEIKHAKLLLSLEDRKEQSEYVFQKLEEMAEFKNAKNVLCYWSLDDELDTTSFVLDWCITKNFYLPKVVGRELTLHKFIGIESMSKGDFGILEPTGEALSDIHMIDFAIVPGIAFSTDGKRMGRGGGFYDRLLPHLKDVFKVGVGYSFQLVKEIPSESHDVNMSMVITA